jgi:hypothetical protein
MKRVAFLLMPGLFIGYSVFGQTHEELNNGLKCQQKWEYRNLNSNISGIILFHQKAGGSCGIFSTASVSIIKSEKGDTLRVLEMCNTDKDFSVGSHISVKSETKPSFRVDIVPYDPKACIILETYFGTLTKN